MKPLARKRQRSPSPPVKTDRERGHSLRQHDRHAKQDGHRSRRSPSPSRRRRSPAQEPSRSNRHTDERESSRPSSRRDQDPHSSNRHRAADSHLERSHQDRPDRSPGSRHNGRDRDHDSRRPGKEHVQDKAERNQRDDRAANDDKRSSRHKDRNLPMPPEPRQDQRDVPRSSRSRCCSTSACPLHLPPCHTFNSSLAVRMGQCWSHSWCPIDSAYAPYDASHVHTVQAAFEGKQQVADHCA